MFSKLRLEAEKVSQANAIALAERYRESGFDSSSPNSTQISGMLICSASSVGIIGSIALGSATASVPVSLAGAQAAIAAAGTVAIGGAALPAVTVVAIGVAVVGLSMFAVGLAKRAIESKNYYANDAKGAAIRSGNQRDLMEFGGKNPSMRDWIKGAKGMIVNALSKSKADRPGLVDKPGRDPGMRAR